MPWSGGALELHQRTLVALDVDELFQDVLHLNEIPGMVHHFIDVLVRGRNLVEQDFRMPVLDSCHRPAQIVHAEERARFRPRIPAPGAMRSGMKAHRMFLADDDVTASAHRAGNHRPVAAARFNGVIVPPGGIFSFNEFYACSCANVVAFHS